MTTSTRSFHDLHEAFQEISELVIEVGIGQFALLWSDEESAWLLSFPTGPKTEKEEA
jgi:hypothetical protein